MILDKYIIKDINNLSSFNYGNDNIINVLNIRSIFENFDELVLMLNSNNSNFDIIVLTETWLLYDFHFELNGYHTVNSLDIYRSPNTNIDKFLESLNNYLEHFDDYNERFIIGSDLSINIMDANLSNDYLNIMAINNFISCINNFTRVTNTTKSCIDHIFTKNIDIHCINSFILECSITDHYGTIIQFNHQLNPISTRTNKKNENNKRLINENIYKVNWVKFLNMNNIDDAMHCFLHNIDEIIQNASTNVAINKTKKFNKLKSWTTKGLVISINNKHKMSKKLLLSPFNINLKMKYIKYRNLLTSLINKAKKLHYQAIFKKYKYNPKKIWQLTNEIADSERSDECIDFTMMCVHCFFLFFVSVNSITSRNNAPISNFEGGFRCKSEYPLVHYRGQKLTFHVLETSKMSENINLPTTFDLSGSNVAEKWKSFKQRFDIYLLASNQQQCEGKRKTALMLHCLGSEILPILNGFEFKKTNDAADYEIVVSKFNEYFIPKKNIVYEQHMFFTRDQKTGENIDEYVKELRLLASSCEFGKLVDTLIRGRLICGLIDNKIKERLLKEGNIGLEKVLDVCRSDEIVRKQMSTMDNGTNNCNIEEIQKFKKYDQVGKQIEESKGKYNSNKNVKIINNCKRCGRNHKINNCPAYGKKCIKCEKLNHFAKQCKSTKSESKINEIEEKEFFIGVVGENKNKNIEKDWIVSLRTNDTGAQANVLPSEILKGINTQVVLEPTKTKLSTYDGNNIKVLGKCNLVIETGNGNEKQKSCEFYVVNTQAEKKVAILGLEDSVKLGIVKRLLEINENDENTSLIKEFKHVFEGVGCIEGNYEIKLKDNFVPVACATRKIPFSLEEPLRKELNKLCELQIIEKVEEFTEWVHPIVLAKKPNGAIRICLDPQNLNKVIQREYFQIPTVEEILKQLGGGKVFSTFDANQGFHQIKLTDESSKMCTFSTPMGRYRYLRMPFGISSAPEIFHKNENKREQFKLATESDKELNMLKEYVIKGWPEKREQLNEENRKYWDSKELITVHDGVLYKSNRIIVPESLRNEMLKKIHFNHMGIEKCKYRARTCLYWLGMNKDIEEVVNRCQICLKYRKANTKEPLECSEVPDRPWQVVGTDLFHFQGKNYIMLVDYFSKFIEFVMIPKLTSLNTINAIKSTGYLKLLDRTGVPNIHQKSKKFIKEWNIKHILVVSSPTNAQSNGMIERYIQTLKKMLVKAEEDNKDIYLALLEYRNTPISKDLASPAEILMGRKINGLLPIEDDKRKYTEVREKFIEIQNEQKQYYDKGAKELKELKEGDKVYLKKKKDEKYWSPGVIKNKIKGRREFWRNRRQLHKTPEVESKHRVKDRKGNTNSKRKTKIPNKFKDFKIIFTFDVNELLIGRVTKT
ncbi:Uncharacterized protein FWK35_00020961 [Aphis craccivora]|uniref:RNA-directed DNA polymerase n=2 Tax=Aphidini TaxID=33387 RepID=A0A6G0Y204_APHCR|nr:Uncharacterized protein FWK35_00020961 [Aphis craccivora]